MYKKNILLKSLFFTVFFISSAVYSDESTDDSLLDDESAELFEEEHVESSEEETLPEGYSGPSDEELFPERGVFADNEPEVPTHTDNRPPVQDSSEKNEEAQAESPSDNAKPSPVEESPSSKNIPADKPATTDKPTGTPSAETKDSSNPPDTNDKVDTPTTTKPEEDSVRGEDAVENADAPKATGTDAISATENSQETTDNDTEVAPSLPVNTDFTTKPNESSTDWFVLPDPEQGNDADFYMQTRPGTAIVIDLNKEGEQIQALTLQPSTNSVVINNGDGTVTYTPNGEFFGTDVFTYAYTNANGEKQEGKVKVTVQESVGQPPQPATCQIYATHSEENGHTQLMTIDPVGYSAVALGPLYQQYDIKGIAIDPLSFMLYAISGKNAVASQASVLYIVNAHTGELVTIGNINFNGLTSLAFHPDGSLWAWSDSEGIIQIDKETGISILVAPIPQVEVVVAVKDTTDKKDTSSTTKTPATPKKEEEVTGTVLFVDATSEESTGTRKNSTSTTETEVTVTTKTVKIKNIQGLAWNSDGSLLYATYGSSRTLWAFNPQTAEFKEACNELPAKVTALETLADGMLMFAVPQKSAGKIYGSKIYVYDPVKCEVILNRSFVTDYSNLESIAWPANCQSLPEIKSWKISFDGDTNTAMCLKEPQWITLKGVAKLDPVNSQAYLETGWRVINPENVSCPATDKKGEVIDCTKEQVSSKQIIIGETEFKVTGWWPGIPDDANEEAVVETLYAANLFDMNGKRLPGRSRIEKTLVGSEHLCAEFLDQQPPCVDEDGKPLEECPAENTCVDEDGKPLEECPAENTCVDEDGNPLEECPEENTCVDEDGKPLEECPAENTCVDKDGKPLEECPAENTCVDEDGKPLEECPAEETDEETCAEGEDCLEKIEEQQEESTEDSEEIEPLTTPYDKATIENYLAGEDYTFAEDDTSISVWYEGQLLQFAFADLLDETAEKLPPQGELILEATDDVNADGNEDYKIIYPDGTVQQVHYLGVIDQKEENVPEETGEEVLPEPEEEAEISSEDEQESQLPDEDSSASEGEEINSAEEEKVDSPKEEKADSPKEEKADSPKEEKVDSPKEEKANSPKEEKVDSPKEEKANSPKEEKVDSPKEEKANSPKEEKVDSPKEEKVDSPKEEKVDSPKEEKVDSPKEESVKVPEKQESVPPPVEEKPSAPVNSSPTTTSDSSNAAPVPIVSD